MISKGLAARLRQTAVLLVAVGGSWMAKRGMIADGKFDEITRMAKEASCVVNQVRRKI